MATRKGRAAKRKLVSAFIASVEANSRGDVYTGPISLKDYARHTVEGKAWLARKAGK